MTTVIAIEKNTSLYCLFVFFFDDVIVIGCCESVRFLMNIMFEPFDLTSVCRLFGADEIVYAAILCVDFSFNSFFFPFSFSSIRFEWFFFGWNEPPNCQRKIKYEIEMKNEETNKKGKIKGKLYQKKRKIVAYRSEA